MKSFFKKATLYTLIVLLFSSCDLFNKEEDKPVDKFLVSYEFVKAYLPELIRAAFDQFDDDYPEIANIKENVKHGVMIYKITYHTAFKGELKTASGLVCVPAGNGTYPLISYQNGTNTLHSNAPSVNPDYELYLLLEFVASTGFVVAIPDYLGFGETDDMFHPYLDRESTVKSVMDMMRATREMVNHYLDVKLNDDLYLAGYSQGGWATMHLQKEIEEKYLMEFNLKASACGAGPYDLKTVNEYITGLSTYPMPYFFGYMFNSYVKLGDVSTPAADVFKAPYAAKITTLYDGTKSGEQINAELATKVADLFTTGYLSGYDTDTKYATIMTTLEKNSVTAWKTRIPTLIIHGMADDFVPTKTSTDIYQDFLAAGVDLDEVEWIGLPGIGHTTGIIPSGAIMMNWFLELRGE